MWWHEKMAEEAAEARAVGNSGFGLAAVAVILTLFVLGSMMGCSAGQALKTSDLMQTKGVE